ncbi:hypothetical protein DFH27DRAFT_650368 [Peziza echinospora]|nr:hypothetical protein DFH27DRAFT_650368 [Peziza echinospora]
MEISIPQSTALPVSPRPRQKKKKTSKPPGHIIPQRRHRHGTTKTNTKTKTSALSLLSLSLLASTPALAADILRFGPGLLPNCAYSCVELYSAQYECPATTTAPAACFCKSTFLAPLLSGSGGICPGACPPGAGAEEVAAWFDGACGNFKGTKPDETKPDPKTPSDKEDGGDKKDNNNDNDKDNKNTPAVNQATKAVDWWRANWQWFLIAFLLITIPLGCYALFFPCRKWARKQIIQRRARRHPSLMPGAIPPPFPPPMPQTATLGIIDPRYAYGGLTSPRLASVPPPPEGAFRNGAVGDPYSPSMTRVVGGANGGYFPANHVYEANVAGASMHEGGVLLVPSPPLPPPPPPPQPTSVRQESWERKVRGEFENRKSLGEKIAFWKGSGGGGKGQQQLGYDVEEGGSVSGTSSHGRSRGNSNVGHGEKR